MSEDDVFARVSELVEHAGRLRDPDARALAQDLVAAVLELHRAALARALTIVDASTIDALAADPVVANVLVLHGLHPTPLAERAQAALASIGAELVAIDEDRARVRATRGSRAAIEQALLAAAPDLSEIVIDEIDAALIPASQLVREGRP